MLPLVQHEVVLLEEGLPALVAHVRAQRAAALRVPAHERALNTISTTLNIQTEGFPDTSLIITAQILTYVFKIASDREV